jgi:hypothetical protein
MTQLQRPGLPTANQLLNHLFETPQLLAAVRELPGPVLGKIIEAVGIEDAAELVALATTEQLEAVFDEDLWRLGRGNLEEHFDPARFALWLHAFSEAGEDAVIGRLTELPLDFVILAVHRLILVIDIEILAVEMSNSPDDLDQVEKALESCLSDEWEEFRLIARDHSVWDEICAALFTLDRDHHELLRQILERCAAMSSEWIDANGGLCEVLSSEEMLESDVRAERDDRRGRQGYVSPADARAFLELARTGAGDPAIRDAITKSYFRELARISSKVGVHRKPPTRKSAANVAGLLKLLGEANVVEPEHATRLIERPSHRATSHVIKARSASSDPSQRLLDRALAQLHRTDSNLYNERMDELAYLANVMIAAPQNQRRRLRPVEALEAVLRLTNRGFEVKLGIAAQQSKAEALRAATALLGVTTADCLFRLAYAGMNTRTEVLPIKT